MSQIEEKDALTFIRDQAGLIDSSKKSSSATQELLSRHKDLKVIKFCGQLGFASADFNREADSCGFTRESGVLYAIPYSEQDGVRYYCQPAKYVIFAPREVGVRAAFWEDVMGAVGICQQVIDFAKAHIIDRFNRDAVIPDEFSVEEVGKKYEVYPYRQ